MSELKMFTMQDVQAEPVSWLWEPYIPRGKITIIQGDPGNGKTTLILAVAAAVVNGEALPGVFAGAPADVIFQTAEDGLADTIKPRLERFGADFSRIHVIDESEQPLSLSDERLEQAIARADAKLLVIDPIQAYLGGADMHSARGMRPLMKALGAVAERTGCAVILIGHLNKKGGAAQYRGLGSIDIYAAARSVLTVGIMDDMRVAVHSKSNLAPPGAPVGFNLDPDFGFAWQGGQDIDVDDLFRDSKHKRESQSDRAKQLILTMLADGAVESKKIMRASEAQGISEKTLNRAKTDLGVYSFKRGETWYWDMPAETQFAEDGQDGQNINMTALTVLPAFKNESGAV